MVISGQNRVWPLITIYHIPPLPFLSSISIPSHRHLLLSVSPRSRSLRHLSPLRQPLPPPLLPLALLAAAPITAVTSLPLSSLFPPRCYLAAAISLPPGSLRRHAATSLPLFSRLPPFSPPENTSRPRHCRHLPPIWPPSLPPLSLSFPFFLPPPLPRTPLAAHLPSPCAALPPSRAPPTSSPCDFSLPARLWLAAAVLLSRRARASILRASPSRRLPISGCSCHIPRPCALPL